LEYLVDARKIIAKGAVDIVDEAVTMLNGHGYKLDDHTRTHLGQFSARRHLRGGEGATDLLSQ
jgi:hypothetical protein